jgi:hypothetical protein
MIGFQVSNMNFKEERELMVKYHKISWILAPFIGSLLLILAPTALGEVLKSPRDSKILECQTALEKFSLRLQERSRGDSQKGSQGRPSHAYYGNLYRQTQEFLASLKNFPSSSPDKCQNYLNVVQDIVGSHSADLGSMPGHSGQQYRGQLTKSLKTIPKRELRNVRYEYAERVKSKEEKKAIGEEEEDLEELSFSPTPIRQASKSKNHLASETKDHEPKF